MYTKEELGFILYNNRSVKGVVSNFLPEVNPITLIRIENQLKECKSNWSDDDRMVEINIGELNTDADDVIIHRKDIDSLTDFFRENSGMLNQDEYNYLEKRGFGEKTILDWEILGLSNFKDREHLKIIGASVHPVLSRVLEDKIENGGIVIPLYDENSRLVNCAVRKIGIESNGSTRTLKYSLACPDIPVWGLNQVGENKEIWITEGIFDTMALSNLSRYSVSCSSAMWSGIQLYQLLKKKLENILIINKQIKFKLKTPQYWIGNGI
mgnify:FL=1